MSRTGCGPAAGSIIEPGCINGRQAVAGHGVILEDLQAPTAADMARASGGQRPPEFLSTHPSSDTRISQLNARMGDAMARSLAARNAGRNPDCR